MLYPAALYTIAFFAILTALFTYLYAHDRRAHFLFWALGWAILALRQLAVTAPAVMAGERVELDAALLASAGLLILLGGIAFSGRARLDAVAIAVFGLELGVLAAFALFAMASLGPGLGHSLATALGVLVAGWIGTGWLIHRYGREEAPIGAVLAGLSLLTWGAWIPASVILDARIDPAGWPATVDAVLGALVVAGMFVLAFEGARVRISERGEARPLLDDDPNMIAVLQDDRIAYANRAFLSRMGRSLKELQRLDTLALVAPEERPEAEIRRARRKSGEIVTGYEVELLDAAGRRVPVVVHADTIRWNGRMALKYELTDLTARRRAEEEVSRVNAELRRMNEELERANRLQTEFLSNTTHELKTPLTSIMANTEILEYEMCGSINDEQRRVLSNISRNSQSLLEMISRLLDFSRQREGVATLRVEEVSPREILAGVAETVRPLLEEKKLHLEIQIDPELESCRLDGEKIYRVYLNLVENAIKFSPHGTILARAGLVDGEFEGSVRDEGIGIPGDRLDDIFQAFTQVDASSTRSYPGVGLGLAICRQLIELHGGRIWAESEPRKGSTFRFRVPCDPSAAAVAVGSLQGGNAV
ncbi:MAG: ATP-binding protein [Gemmatimonadota bacterium]